MAERKMSDDPNVLDCYLKGTFAAENPILREHSDALRPYLYYDDLEVCDGLSPNASGKQKLGAFYLGLDNIHPKFRASVKTISLDASLLKAPGGMDFVLQRAEKDLSSLETGVVLNGSRIFGTLVAFTGDNLGVHQVGGFKCGFTAYRFFQFCTAVWSLTHTLVREDPNLLRLLAEYEEQLKDIRNAPTQKEQDRLSTKYGINSQCCLNLLSSFHVLKGLPPDFMHDILEEVLPRTVKNLLKYCIEVLKIMTLDWLNAAIRDFDYGFSEREDRPEK